MDRAELLERASRYRALANTALDERAKQALLDLAADYEAMAGEEGSDEEAPGRDPNPFSSRSRRS
jgi:hypothetical protein